MSHPRSSPIPPRAKFSPRAPRQRRARPFWAARALRRRGRGSRNKWCRSPHPPTASARRRPPRRAFPPAATAAERRLLLPFRAPAPHRSPAAQRPSPGAAAALTCAAGPRLRHASASPAPGAPASPLPRTRTARRPSPSARVSARRRSAAASGGRGGGLRGGARGGRGLSAAPSEQPRVLGCAVLLLPQPPGRAGNRQPCVILHRRKKRKMNSEKEMLAPAINWPFAWQPACLQHFRTRLSGPRAGGWVQDSSALCLNV